MSTEHVRSTHPALGFLGVVFGFASFVGLLVNAASVFRLAQEAFQLRLAALTEALMRAYADLLSITLDWLNPVVLFVIGGIGGLFSLDLSMHPHWRDVFVVMSLYFVGDVRIDVGRGRANSAVATFVVGVLIALISSATAGSVPLNDRSLLPLCAPIAGFVLYEVLRGAWNALFYPPPQHLSFLPAWGHFLRRFALMNLIFGAVAVGAAYAATMLMPGVGGVNLALLIAYLAAMAGRNIIQAVRYGSRSGERWWALQTGKFGLHVAAYLVGALLAALFNAGLLLAAR